MEYILLVENGPYKFKQKYIEKIIGAPFHILFLKNSSCRKKQNKWYEKYFSSEDIIKAEFRNPCKLIEKINKFLSDREIVLKGVTTYQEEAVQTTQYIAETLNLPRIANGDSSVLRNKAKMREAFWKSGIPQPRYQLCKSFDEVLDAVKYIGIPCIIKPVELLASLGVFKIEKFDKEIICKAYTNATKINIKEEDLRYAFNISSDVLIEEYIETVQEISIEGVVINESIDIVSVTKKYLGKEPRFEEVGHLTPFYLEEKTYEKIKSILVKVSTKLGLANTIIHAEFRLREDKSPILIEVGARLAGDFIPKLVLLARGVDMITGSLYIAANKPFNFKSSLNKVYRIEFLKDSKKTSQIKKHEKELKAFPFIHEVSIYTEGSEGRLGHIIYCGDDIRKIEEQRELIIKKLY